MEVDDEAYGDIEKFHVAQELGFVDGKDLLDDFEFKDQVFFEQDVEPKRFLEDEALVFDWNLELLPGFNLPKKELPHHAFFINRFDQARPFQPMNLNRRTDRNVAQFISPLKFRMHDPNFVPFVSFCKKSHRHHLLQQRVHHFAARHSGGFGVVGKMDAVGEAGGGDGADVLGRNEVLLLEPGVGAGGGSEVVPDFSPRTMRRMAASFSGGG